MVERLRLKFEDAVRAKKTLEEILQEPFSVIIRDAAIQRFEFTFEAYWKFLKEYLKEQEGIICNSPKACFREIFSIGLLSEQEVVGFLEMTDDRNMTSHTYKEEVSQIIFSKLPGYFSLLNSLLNRIHLP
jgi:nucleotidyltransferase substrate binding protein (TIGR01987 family)